MKSERMSEIEDGAQPTKGELIYAVVFCSAITIMFFVMFGLLIMRIVI